MRSRYTRKNAFRFVGEWVWGALTDHATKPILAFGGWGSVRSMGTAPQMAFTAFDILLEGFRT